MTCLHQIFENWWLTGDVYGCHAAIIFIGDIRIVTNVTGDGHLHGLSNNDVKAFVGNGGILKHAPHNLHEFYPNLEVLEMLGVELEEISAEALSGLYKLRTLIVPYNKIKVIGNDLFKNNPLMIGVSIHNNLIRHVAHNVFDHLDRLERILFQLTSCMDAAAGTPDELNLLKFRLSVNCPPTFEMIQERILSGDEFQKKVDQRAAEIVSPLNSKLNEVAQQLLHADHRLNEAEAKLNEVDQQLLGADHRLKEVEAKLSEAEARLNETGQRLNDADQRFDQIDQEMNELMSDMEQGFIHTDARLNRLEGGN